MHSGVKAKSLLKSVGSMFLSIIQDMFALLKFNCLYEFLSMLFSSLSVEIFQKNAYNLTKVVTPEAVRVWKRKKLG